MWNNPGFRVENLGKIWENCGEYVEDVIEIQGL